MLIDDSTCSPLLLCRVLLPLSFPAAAFEVLIVVVVVVDEPASFDRAGERGCRAGILDKVADIVRSLEMRVCSEKSQRGAGASITC